jgi:hypothetical protein
MVGDVGDDDDDEDDGGGEGEGEGTRSVVAVINAASSTSS